MVEVDGLAELVPPSAATGPSVPNPAQVYYFYLYTEDRSFVQAAILPRLDVLAEVLLSKWPPRSTSPSPVGSGTPVSFLSALSVFQVRHLRRQPTVTDSSPREDSSIASSREVSPLAWCQDPCLRVRGLPKKGARRSGPMSAGLLSNEMYVRAWID